jgi:Flp pilus assembly protein TadG
MTCRLAMIRPLAMIRRLREIGSDRAGAALVEMALILPVLLTLFMGSFELTLLVLANMKCTNAAQTMADLIAAQTDVTTANLADYYNGTQFVMSPFSGTPLKIGIASVTFSSSGAEAVAWTATEGSGASNVSNPTTLASGLGTKNDSVIVVQSTYKYTSPISYVLSTSYTLTQTAFSRPRNVTSVSYN